MCTIKADDDLLYFADAVRGLLRLDRLYTPDPTDPRKMMPERRDMIRFGADPVEEPEEIGGAGMIGWEWGR